MMHSESSTNRLPSGLFLAALLLLSGCSRDKSKADDPAAAPIAWRKVTLTIANKKYPVEVGRYERAIPVKLLEPPAAKRDTPIDAWNSWQALSVGGQDDKDLKAYAECYLEPAAFLARLKSPARQFFDDNRKADEQPQALGQVKSGKYVAVVYKVRGSAQYRAAAMVPKNGQYVIDDRAKLSDPVLRDLAADGYKIIKESTTTAPSDKSR